MKLPTNCSAKTLRVIIRWNVAVILSLAGLVSAGELPEHIRLASGWELQPASKVADDGGMISRAGYRPSGWYSATVPATVLTSLVNDQVYPEPLYGENNRPDKIPETLCRTTYWYRTTFNVPPTFKGRQVWLTFKGINYTAEVYVNGTAVGTIEARSPAAFST